MPMTVEERRQYARDHYAKNKEAYKERRASRPKEVVAKYARASALKAKFGISKADYDLLFKKQRGRCAVCKVKSEKTFHVDHCHKTKKVRGLLCGKCNMGLGLFNDDEKVLSAALAYLKEGK